MTFIERLKEFFKKKMEYVIAILVLIFFLVFSVTESGKKTEFSMYDTLLGIKPQVTERKDVLLVCIDDSAIEQIGAWPWSRDIIADTLVRLREFGIKRTVFDIEYLNPGQIGVNLGYVKNEFPAKYKGVQTEIIDYLSSFTDAVATKNIPLAAVPEVGSEMSGYIDQQMKDLSGSITANIFRDNDTYFANAIHFFGQTFLTINAAQINTNDETKVAAEYARKNLMFTNVTDSAGLIARENAETRRKENMEKGISPAILPLISKAAGAGFPNVILDSDGVSRRIELLVENEGAYVGQLVFSPILSLLKPEEIIRKDRTLILKNALDLNSKTEGKRKDILIPLDDDGRFLINWLKKKSIVDPLHSDNPAKNSFKYLSIYNVYMCDRYEERLIDNLSSIEALIIKNASGYLSYHDAALWLHSSYNDLGVWKQGLLTGTRSDFDEYFTARKDFFNNYGEFLEGGFDTEIYTTIEEIKSRSGDAKYDEVKESIRKNFDIYREDLKTYLTLFNSMNEKYRGDFCVIGDNATGTSDIGVNPFSKNYVNVGTHANVYNTIMSGEFINPLPMWASWLFALILSAISALAFRRITSLKLRIAYGIGSSIFVFAFITFLFAAFRIYIEMLVPLLSVSVTFLLVSILKFVFSEQEKSFLRKAFTMYLSSDVVNEIVADPSKLKLGGQEKRITALFTDIKSFSTLSEKVTPEHLVRILNKYLTVMSDLVLDQKGTIDKYIGDAIVSFFGAPIDLPDHASRACLAAVRMKEAEKKLNDELLASGEIPMPILTRIGINSGAMVVGNMGTDNKMNYTIMGNDVNLAARLEGVNKQYGTWILVSESTWSETNGMFLGRKLDRVRVVGIDTPVQLYNIMAVLSEAPAKMVALVDQFNIAIDAYRERRFADALALFTTCTEMDSEDKASELFRERVEELVKNGIPDDWSDVINMTSK